jgi:hypothetical protein
MSSSNIYYVYAYLRNKDSKTAKAGTPYYIGKGNGRRSHTTHRYKGKGVQLPVNKSDIIMLAEQLTESEAHQIEIDTIAHYGRIDLGNGILRNETDGGEGLSNPSIESRIKKGAKVSKALTGVPKTEKHKENLRKQRAENPRTPTETQILKMWSGHPGETNGMFNKRHSEETKQEWSKKRKGRSSLNKGKKLKVYPCPHCGLEVTGGNLKRWHGDNCKRG